MLVDFQPRCPYSFQAPNQSDLLAAKAHLEIASGRMISTLTAAYYHFSPNVDRQNLSRISAELREIADKIDASLMAPVDIAAE